MRCVHCKENPATVKLTRIVKNKVIELHLCQKCAAEISPYQKKIAQAQGINQLFEQLMKLEKAESEASAADGGQSVPVAAKCKTCGLPFQQYKRTLMLGCPHCYESFGDHLLTDLRKIHGSVQHSGKIPPEQQARIAKGRQLEWLREQLRQSLEKDDYDQATQLRDQILVIEQELGLKPPPAQPPSPPSEAAI